MVTCHQKSFFLFRSRNSSTRKEGTQATAQRSCGLPFPMPRQLSKNSWDGCPSCSWPAARGATARPPRCSGSWRHCAHTTSCRCRHQASAPCGSLATTCRYRGSVPRCHSLHSTTVQGLPRASHAGACGCNTITPLRAWPQNQATFPAPRGSVRWAMNLFMDATFAGAARFLQASREQPIAQQVWQVVYRERFEDNQVFEMRTTAVQMERSGFQVELFEETVAVWDATSDEEAQLGCNGWGTLWDHVCFLVAF